MEELCEAIEAVMLPELERHGLSTDPAFVRRTTHRFIIERCRMLTGDLGTPADLRTAE